MLDFFLYLIYNIFGEINLEKNKRKNTVAITIMGIFVVLTMRLAWIQFVQGAELKERASRQQTLNKTITPKRGSIYDANGKALAISSEVDTISINPSKLVVEHEDEEVAKEKNIRRRLHKDCQKYSHLIMMKC